jgi:hypothetical protein
MIDPVRFTPVQLGFNQQQARPGAAGAAPGNGMTPPVAPPKAREKQPPGVCGQRVERQLGEQSDRFALLLVGQRDHRGTASRSPRRRMEVVARPWGGQSSRSDCRGRGASAPTGELRGASRSYKCSLLTPRCDRLSRRFHGVSNSARSGRASISREHAARIRQLADGRRAAPSQSKERAGPTVSTLLFASRGLMLWLLRRKLVGSQASFSATSRP